MAVTVTGINTTKEKPHTLHWDNRIGAMRRRPCLPKFPETEICIRKTFICRESPGSLLQQGSYLGECFPRFSKANSGVTAAEDSVVVSTNLILQTASTQVLWGMEGTISFQSNACEALRCAEGNP